MADPISAPSSRASAALPPSVPAATKDTASIATAVELCSRIAALPPKAAARSALWSAVRSPARSRGMNARSTPVRIMRTAHSSKATEPARLRTKTTMALALSGGSGRIANPLRASRTRRR